MLSVRHDDQVEYDAFTADELLGSQEGDEPLTNRSAGTESEDLHSINEDDEQTLLSQLSALQVDERPRSVRFEDAESEDSEEPKHYPRAVAAGITTSSSPPRSPLLKKFAPVQDRRANTIVLEALHLADISRDEIGLIERSIKRLNDAILGFSMLVDRQVKIVGAASTEERGRIKADIQDLSSQLKASNALIESTCARMKNHLVAGRNQLSAHKRKLMADRGVGDSDSEISGCTSPRCSVNEQQYYQQQQLQDPQYSQSRPQSMESGIRFNRSPPRPTITANIPYGCRGLAATSGKSPMKSSTASPAKRTNSPTVSRTPRETKVPLIWILKPQPANAGIDEDITLTGIVSTDLFSSVLDAVGLHDKEFLDMRELRTFLHGILAFFIARNPSLRFMDKAFHRRLMPEYVNELADALVMGMQLIPQLSGRSVIVTPVNTLEEFVCMDPFRFDRLLHTVHVNPSDTSSIDADAATEAASTVYPTSPFKEQMSRNGDVLNGGKVVELVVSKNREPELIETAEQTLGMAKLLHDLATAECEARNGNRISIRAQVPHAKEFSKAYIASSKELMLQDTSFI
ncbi:hypothetical protein P3T76_015730 [Phytophthora citrophthora]|uniref:Uncharacterized protein n=1 Tax=Phytophthora citrophthora TaxID=4793 RepID=A0AAD9LAT7_9STRA|nr:hypothetical protein P3T76_015730 [Phytophthora citrophthora]